MGCEDKTPPLIANVWRAGNRNMERETMAVPLLGSFQSPREDRTCREVMEWKNCGAHPKKETQSMEGSQVNKSWKGGLT